MQDVLAQYAQLLSQRKDEGRLRALRSIMPGEGATILVNRRPLINFASNDYLGLSQHEHLKQRSIEYINRFGVGSTASRLVCGNLEPFEAVERKLASLKGTETALILPSGFQTNLTMIPALANGTETFIACDRLSHNSLLSGVQLSGAKWTRYQHNDTADLTRRFNEADERFTKKWIITESVFSMDGDRVDMPALLAAARDANASLYVDEAHATGVLGQSGMGMCVGETGITAVMGTFGKALGSFGAYIACTQTLKDYLINFCSGLIYSTALPPAVLGAIDAALDVVPTMEKQRQVLLDNAEQFRAKLNHAGFDTGASSTQIIPVIVGSDDAALSLAQHLEDGGIFAPAIRPPTVPDDAARVRFSLSLLHSREHLERVLTLMRNWRAH